MMAMARMQCGLAPMRIFSEGGAFKEMPAIAGGLVRDVGRASFIDAGSAATAWFGGIRPCRVMA